MSGSAQGIRAGKAYVEVGAKDSALAAGLDAARMRLQSWGKSLAHLGLETVLFDVAKLAPFALAARSFAGQGSDLVKWSGQLGISARELSQWQGVAAQANVKFDDLIGSFRRFRQVAVDASNGSEEHLKALRAMGYTFEQWDRLSPSRQLGAVADQAKRFASVAARTSFLETMGISDEMMPMILRGSAGLNRLAGEAERLGMVMTNEDAAAAEKLREAWAILGMQWERFVAQIGAAMAGPMRELAEWFSVYAVRAIDWVRANRGLIWSTLEAGAAWVALGAAAAVLGASLHVLGMVFGWLRTAVLLTTLAFRAFFLNTFGLALLTTGVLVACFLTMTDAGRAMADDLGKAWGVIAQDATEAFGAIGQAIAAGNLRAAWRVLVAFMNLEWLRLTNGLRRVWDDLSVGVQVAWLDIRSAATAAFFGIGEGWLRMIAFMGNAFVDFGTSVRTTWTNISAGFVRTIGLYLQQIERLRGNAAGVRVIEEKLRDVEQQREQINRDVRQAGVDVTAAVNENVRDRAERGRQINAEQQALIARQRQNVLVGPGAGEGEAARDLADAQRELRQAIDAARRPGGAFAERHEQLRAGGDEARRGSTMRDLQRFGLDQQRQSVVGSFNPFGFSRLGGGGRTPLVFERIERNTGRAADRLGIIEERGRGRNAPPGFAFA